MNIPKKSERGDSMQFVIDELNKSLKYHTRQLDDNKHKIQCNKEAIDSLECANLRHEQAIKEITELLAELEKRQG